MSIETKYGYEWEDEKCRTIERFLRVVRVSERSGKGVEWGSVLDAYD